MQGGFVAHIAEIKGTTIKTRLDFIEERFGLPVHVPQQRGAAALGAAGLAFQP